MAFPILGALKLAVNAGSHIYKKKKETQMMMANAQAKHAEKMANGELEYSGKLLEARQSDWKDEFVLVVLPMMKGSKPDFLDLDKDNNKTESMKSAAASAKKMMKGGRVKKMGGGMSKLNPGLRKFMMAKKKAK
jgi:malate/lactate dehydrogenase